MSRALIVRETEGRTEVTGAGWGHGENEKLSLNGHRLSAGEDQKALEVEGADVGVFFTLTNIIIFKVEFCKSAKGIILLNQCAWQMTQTSLWKWVTRGECGKSSMYYTDFMILIKMKACKIPALN